MNTDWKLLVVLGAVFVGVLTIGIALGSKLITIFGLTASVSALTFPVTFLVTDVVTEIWGKEKAKQIVWAGFITILVVFAFIEMAIVLPSAEFWKLQEAYAEIFGTSLRIIVGGLAAYFVGQMHDIWAFQFWKKVTKGRHLWLRNNLSTSVSQLLDTVIFVTIAFAGLTSIIPLMIGQYLIKLALAVLDTPFVYLGVWLIRRRNSDS